MLYLDTSAVVKTILREPESTALRRWLRRHPQDIQVSSSLLRTELRRAVGLAVSRGALGSVQDDRYTDGVRRRLTEVRLVRLSDDVLDHAGELPPPTLRSLDALHLVTALQFTAELTGFLTYDHRLASAADNAGLPVVSPGAG